MTLTTIDDLSKIVAFGGDEDDLGTDEPEEKEDPELDEDEEKEKDPDEELEEEPDEDDDVDEE